MKLNKNVALHSGYTKKCSVWLWPWCSKNLNHSVPGRICASANQHFNQGIFGGTVKLLFGEITYMPHNLTTREHLPKISNHIFLQVRASPPPYHGNNREVLEYTVTSSSTTVSRSIPGLVLPPRSSAGVSSLHHSTISPSIPSLVLSSQSNADISSLTSGHQTASQKDSSTHYHTSLREDEEMQAKVVPLDGYSKPRSESPIHLLNLYCRWKF